jgi:hypothetical protein
MVFIYTSTMVRIWVMIGIALKPTSTETWNRWHRTWRLKLHLFSLLQTTVLQVLHLSRRNTGHMGARNHKKAVSSPAILGICWNLLAFSMFFSSSHQSPYE